MSEVIRPLPERITDVIRLAGGRKVVLVEGPDDELAFREWFEADLADVVFVPVSGKQDVLSRLPEIIAQRPDVDVYGIVDRDFADDATVQAAWEAPDARLFLLRRFSVENYALEVALIFEVLRIYFRNNPPINSLAEMEATVLSWCQSLKTTMASNSVLRESSDEVRLFDEKHELKERDFFVEQTASRTGLDTSEADVQIAARETEIEARLGALESAHTVINGKHLLYQLCHFTNRHRGRRPVLDTELIFSLLIDNGKKTTGPHGDLRTLVHSRILKRPTE